MWNGIAGGDSLVLEEAHQPDIHGQETLSINDGADDTATAMSPSPGPGEAPWDGTAPMELHRTMHTGVRLETAGHQPVEPPVGGPPVWHAGDGHDTALHCKPCDAAEAGLPSARQLVSAQQQPARDPLTACTQPVQVVGVATTTLQPLKADASVQACESSSPVKEPSASVSCQCDGGTDVDEMTQGHSTDPGRHDAAVQNDLVRVWNDDCTPAGRALSPTPTVGRDPNGGSLRMPPWVATIPRATTVAAPDPGTLLAVQDIRARLEALTRDMASPTRLSVLPSAAACGAEYALRPDTSSFTADRQRGDECSSLVDCTEQEPSVVSTVNRPQNSVEVQPGKEDGSVESSQSVKISVSVVTEVPGRVSCVAVGRHERSQTQNESVQANLHINGKECMISGQQALVEYSHKACQADDSTDADTPKDLPALGASSPVAETPAKSDMSDSREHRAHADLCRKPDNSQPRLDQVGAAAAINVCIDNTATLCCAP